MNRKKPYQKNSQLVVRDISESLGKLPPQALDLEEAVLGALMLEKNAIKAIADFLREEHFYSEQHKEIFHAIMELFKESKPIDMKTVVNCLRTTGKIELVGGAYYVAELTSRVSSAANIEQHARIIVELGIKREIIMVASFMHQEAYEDTSDVFELLEKSEKGIIKLAPTNTRNVSDAKEVLSMTVADMQSKKGNNGVTGIPSGFYELDKITFGFQNSTLILIAARPGVGKTAFLLSTILKSTIDHKIPVAFFSLEMSKIQLGQRINSILSEIELNKVVTCDLDDHEWTRMMAATANFAKAPLYIDDSSSLSIFDLKARAKRMKEDKGVKMIVVDYLQLMKGDKEGNREQEISSISRGLKEISKDLNIPVIALSQLSRSVELRGGDKRPMLSDLRESGSLEQDSDMVQFLYRPAYYGIKQDEEGRDISDVMEVIVAKNRQGSLDNVILKFVGKFTKITDYHHQPPHNFTKVETRLPYKEEEAEGDNLPF